MATPISGQTSPVKGYTVPPGTLFFSMPSGKFSEVKPDSHEGVRVPRDIFPDSPFHLSPVNGPVEEIYTCALAHFQASSGPVGMSMDAPDRDSNIYGLSGPTSKATSQAYPTQLSGSLGLQEAVPRPKGSPCRHRIG